jgi:protein-tyrosine phosphatase
MKGIYMQTKLEQIADYEYSFSDQQFTIHQTRKRFLPFSGVDNFRDLGGYPTKDGSRTRWGRLYRSGHLHRATDEDRQQIFQLGITKLVDFRSDEERKKEPDRLTSDHGIIIVRLPIQENGKPPLSEEIRQRIKNRELNGLDPNHKMKQMYRMLADDYSQQYQDFFHALLESDGSPILWHCSAGKDRAGFAAALLLKILGVPDDVILEDYLLSQGNVTPLGLRFLSIALMRGLKAARFARRMNEVDASWLMKAFDTIDDNWGNFELYRSEALKLTQRDINRLRTIYLE